MDFILIDFVGNLDGLGGFLDIIVVFIFVYVFSVDLYVVIFNYYFYIVGLVVVQLECFVLFFGYILVFLLKSGCMGEIWVGI